LVCERASFDLVSSANVPTLLGADLGSDGELVYRPVVRRFPSLDNLRYLGLGSGTQELGSFGN